MVSMFEGLGGMLRISSSMKDTRFIERIGFRVDICHLLAAGKLRRKSTTTRATFDARKKGTGIARGGKDSVGVLAAAAVAKGSSPQQLKAHIR